MGGKERLVVQEVRYRSCLERRGSNPCAMPCHFLLPNPAQTPYFKHFGKHDTGIKGLDRWMRMISRFGLDAWWLSGWRFAPCNLRPLAMFDGREHGRRRHEGKTWNDFRRPDGKAQQTSKYQYFHRWRIVSFPQLVILSRFRYVGKPQHQSNSRQEDKA